MSASAIGGLARPPIVRVRASSHEDADAASRWREASSAHDSA